MKSTPRAMTLAVLTAAFIIGTNAIGQSTQPDNSANNKQHDTTADKQSSAEQDRKLAKAIRHSVVETKDLSTYAHNVKIIVNNGAVTLKGPVKSEDEKSKIAEIASQAAGGTEHVTNDITVMP
jgi:hyperosmotically inducible protein